MREKIEIDRDSWRYGYGPLSSEMMEKFGLRECEEQVINDHLLGTYVDNDGNFYEVIQTDDGVYLADTPKKMKRYTATVEWTREDTVYIDAKSRREAVAKLYLGDCNLDDPIDSFGPCWHPVIGSVRLKRARDD
jgi:hypothetical protein